MDFFKQIDDASLTAVSNQNKVLAESLGERLRPDELVVARRLVDRLMFDLVGSMPAVRLLDSSASAINTLGGVVEILNAYIIAAKSAADAVGAAIKNQN